MKKDQTLRVCLDLCDRILEGNYSSEVRMAVLSFKIFFEEHQGLEDAVAVGRYWDYENALMERFMEREDWYRKLGFMPIPVIVKETTPSSVLDALETLSEGGRRILDRWKIYYYSLSHFVPDDAMERWKHPCDCLIVDTVQEAEKLKSESLAKIEKEKATDTR
jgi:hypothetical protein